jgi:signal transduction histidine kinase
VPIDHFVRDAAETIRDIIQRLAGLCLGKAVSAADADDPVLYEQGRELSVLQERARLARDLHDAVSQKLFSVRAKAAASAILVQRDPGRAIEEIESIAALAGEAHAELRAVIDGLAPPELAAGGLAGSVRGYAALAARTYGTDVLVRVGDLPDLDPGAADRGLPGSPGSDR